MKAIDFKITKAKELFASLETQGAEATVAYSGLYPFSDFGHIRSLWINDF